jgi:hypothetical protein
MGGTCRFVNISIPSVLLTLRQLSRFPYVLVRELARQTLSTLSAWLACTVLSLAQN